MPSNLPPKPTPVPPPPREPLTFDRLMQLGGFAALGAAFQSNGQADLVLDRISWPQQARPNFNSYMNPEAYWRHVCQEVSTGRTEGGLEALLASAAHDRPFNRLFSQYTRRETPPPVTDDEANHHPSLFIISRRPPTEVLELVQAEAAQLQLPGEVELEVWTETGLAVFGFTRATAEQVLRLGEAVRTALRPTPAAPVRMNVTANGDRSTLLDRLIAEGPDGRRYELTGVPADTPPRDIARAVMDDYKDASGATGPAAATRSVVVDLVQPDGTTNRLNPDQPIGHQGVCEGDRLEVQPESRAAVHPVLRGTALARVRNEVVAYCTSHPGVAPDGNDPLTPTEYFLTFEANGWAPPDQPGLPPREVVRHEVSLVLPDEFPIVAPAAFWLTPIFHPNINPGSPPQQVCLGELMDQYEPGMHFGRLIQTLIDIAAYRNYNLESMLDSDAGRWAASADGQDAIEARGGVSYTRMRLRALVDAVGPKPSFGVRKLTP